MKFKYLIYKEEASELGLKFYCVGKPCKNGHESVRYTSTGMCLECRRMHERNRIQKDPAAHVARIMIGYWKNPILWRKRRVEYRAKDIVESRRKEKERRDANIEVFRQRSREYNKNNKEKIAAHSRNREARKRGNGGSHSGADILDILRMQKEKCAYCRVKLGKKYHVDHIVPLKLGGANDRRNLQILCQPCNQAKSARDPISFMQMKGMLL